MKKRMNFKRVLSLFALLAITVSMLVFTSCGKTAADSTNGVVLILNNMGTSAGSGFAIGAKGQPVEYIVTNYHVIDSPTLSSDNSAIVYFNAAANKQMKAEIYYKDAQKDIAILRLPEPTTEREALALCKTENIKKGDICTALGFPDGDIVANYVTYGPSSVKVAPGFINDIVSTSGEIDNSVYRLVIQHSCGTHEGNSGGPLVNERGEVIGINTFYTQANTGNVNNLATNEYAVSIDELITIIERERIPVDIKISNGFPMWIIFVGGGAVLVLILVLILVLALRKGKGSSAPVSTPTVAADVPNTPVAPVGARLICVGGVLNGKKYSLSGSVRIGRDATRCAITYPVGTQGVSALHCEVTFDGNVCYVKDLGSSYGTFTGTGVKLTKDVPVMLRSGDKFYLASPENTFEIRF